MPGNGYPSLDPTEEVDDEEDQDDHNEDSNNGQLSSFSFVGVVRKKSGSESGAMTT